MSVSNADEDSDSGFMRKVLIGRNRVSLPVRRCFMRSSATVVLSLFAFVNTVGCSSSRSTMLTRNECNTGWNKIGHLHGTPITLRVPTHVRIYVYEKYCMERVTVAAVSRWQRADLPPLYDFGSEVLYTDKIFTTDFIRPAAGTLNLDVDYSDQYVQRVQQDITDNTLKDVTALLATLPGKFLPLPVGATKAGDDPGVDWKEVKSVVAANVFDIDDPNFEENIASFVQEHLHARVAIHSTDGQQVSIAPIVPRGQPTFESEGVFAHLNQ